MHRAAGQSSEVVPPDPVIGADTTGAGDAFAAGFLVGPWRDDPDAATIAGHRSAARLLAGRMATVAR